MQSSQFGNDKVFRSPNTLCPNCQSTEFYRDSQAQLVCIYCGLELEGFVVETQEILYGDDEDGAAVQYDTQRSRVIKDRATPTTPIAQRAVDIIDLLSLCQCALIVIFRDVTQIVAKDNRQFQIEMLTTLKRFWSLYLEKWETADCDCQIMGAFNPHLFNAERPYCFCSKNAFKHPSFPSRELLLGIVYLTLRWHRLDIIPSDIVRWCNRGLVPYYFIWDSLPQELQSLVVDTPCASFFQRRLEGIAITSLRIWYEITSLSSSLNVVLPPLNAAAVAMGMIHSLGLPQSVWIIYSKLTQLFVKSEPMVHVSTIDEHFGDHIMATIIIAYMMTPRWTEDSLHRYTALSTFDHSKATALPEVIDIKEQVPRKLLLLYLKQVKAMHGQDQPRATHEHEKHALNDLVLHMLNALKVPGTGEELPSHLQLNEYSFTMKQSALFLSENTIAHHLLTEEEKQQEQFLSHLPYKQMHNDQYAFTSYSRHMEDITGWRSMSYSTLIERCARHLCIPPLTLQNVVDKIDRQIVSICLEGKLDKQVVELKTYLDKKVNRAIKKNLQQQDELLAEDDKEIRMYRSYQKRVGSKLANLHRTALNEMENDQDGNKPEVVSSAIYDRQDWWDYEDEDSEAADDQVNLNGAQEEQQDQEADVGGDIDEEEESIAAVDEEEAGVEGNEDQQSISDDASSAAVNQPEQEENVDAEEEFKIAPKSSKKRKGRATAKPRQRAKRKATTASSSASATTVRPPRKTKLEKLQARRVALNQVQAAVTTHDDNMDQDDANFFQDQITKTVDL